MDAGQHEEAEEGLPFPGGAEGARKLLASLPSCFTESELHDEGRFEVVGEEYTDEESGVAVHRAMLDGRLVCAIEPLTLYAPYTQAPVPDSAEAVLQLYEPGEELAELVARVRALGGVPKHPAVRRYEGVVQGELHGVPIPRFVLVELAPLLERTPMTLAARVATCGGALESEAADWLRDAASGLAHLHANDASAWGRAGLEQLMIGLDGRVRIDTWPDTLRPPCESAPAAPIPAESELDGAAPGVAEDVCAFAAVAAALCRSAGVAEQPHPLLRHFGGLVAGSWPPAVPTLTPLWSEATVGRCWENVVRELDDVEHGVLPIDLKDVTEGMHIRLETEEGRRRWCEVLEIPREDGDEPGIVVLPAGGAARRDTDEEGFLIPTADEERIDEEGFAASAYTVEVTRRHKDEPLGLSFASPHISLVVREVQPSGATAAGRAGLRRFTGHLLTHVDGEPAYNLRDLKELTEGKDAMRFVFAPRRRWSPGDAIATHHQVEFPGVAEADGAPQHHMSRFKKGTLGVVTQVPGDGVGTVEVDIGKRFVSAHGAEHERGREKPVFYDCFAGDLEAAPVTARTRPLEPGDTVMPWHGGWIGGWCGGYNKCGWVLRTGERADVVKVDGSTMRLQAPGLADPPPAPAPPRFALRGPPPISSYMPRGLFRRSESWEGRWLTLRPLRAPSQHLTLVKPTMLSKDPAQGGAAVFGTSVRMPPAEKGEGHWRIERGAAGGMIAVRNRRWPQLFLNDDGGAPRAFPQAQQLIIVKHDEGPGWVISTQMRLSLSARCSDKGPAGVPCFAEEDDDKVCDQWLLCPVEIETAPGALDLGSSSLGSSTAMEGSKMGGSRIGAGIPGAKKPGGSVFDRDTVLGAGNVQWEPVEVPGRGVVIRKNAVVLSEASEGGRVVGELGKGDAVTVTEVKGAYASIISPLLGWAPVWAAKGRLLLASLPMEPSPDTFIVSGNAQLDGEYEIDRHDIHGMPVWCRGKKGPDSAAIAATESGFWRIAMQDSEPNDGLWSSGNHDGTLPHRCPSWELGWGGAEAEGVMVAVPKPETPQDKPLWEGLGFGLPAGVVLGGGAPPRHADPAAAAADDEEAGGGGGDIEN